jgi:hypothetical protein
LGRFGLLSLRDQGRDREQSQTRKNNAADHGRLLRKGRRE